MHKHVTVSRTEARAMASHPQLDIDFCRCGAFRLAGCERWVEVATCKEGEYRPMRKIKGHRHKVANRSAARLLGTHATMRVEDCACGAFRLLSVSKWIEPSSRDLTIAEACQYLNVGYDVIYRMLWKGLVHGDKRAIAGSHKPGWYIPVAELDRFRFARLRR